MRSKRDTKQRISKKKGMFFTVDALVGASILIAVVIMTSNYYIAEKRTSLMDSASQDLIGVLANLRVGDFDNAFVDSLISNGTITKVNSSVLVQIGEFWATGNTDLAVNLSREVIESFGLSNINIGLYLNDETLFTINNTPQKSVYTNKRFISGIDKDKPLDGFISRASIKGENVHFATKYVYFGGFIGQGNVTRKFFLPDDTTDIKSASLELDTPTNFSFFINGNYAGSYAVSDSKPYLTPAYWNISSSYLSYILPGENTIKYVFEGYDKYIAGGLFKVSYFTNSSSDPTTVYMSNTSASSRFYMEGTEGFINTYSSFYVPGNLSSLKMYLKFDISNADAVAFLKLGRTTVLENNTLGQNEITLDNDYLSQKISADGISYEDLSLNTIPLRFGLGNLTASYSNADIMLVNDVSGSMEWCTNQTESCCSNGACQSWPPGCSCGNTGSYCGYDYSASHWKSTCTSGDVKRIEAMKNASISFISSVLANAGPLIGLVSYETSTSDVYGLTDSEASLQGEINSYDADGGTCICCGINSAVSVLSNTSTDIVISRNSPGWRYLADQSTPAAGWNLLSYDDSSWSFSDSAFGRGYYNWWQGFEADTTLPNYNGYYYFRKKFNITDVGSISDTKLSISSDDGTIVYVNGNQVNNDINDEQYASYWNNNNIDVSSYLVEGENVIAVQLRNRRNTASSCWWQCNYFDAELSVSTEGDADPRYKAIVVMSDGQANYECAQQGVTGDLNGDGYSDTAADDAIQAACDAYDDYGIIVHAVGFGADVDEDTLTDIAACGSGNYYSSSNVDDLLSIYNDLADIIVEDSTTQITNISGVAGILYPDSYIEFNYTTSISPPQYGKIELSAQSSVFGNNVSSGSIYIPSDADLIDTTVVTYSAERWSDNVTVVNSGGAANAFLLEDYSYNYKLVGDPYRVHVPVSLISKGESNSIIARTGISPENSTGGSPSDYVIYTVRVDNSVDYTDVFETAEGCTWHVGFEDGSYKTFDIPSNYSGSQDCYFMNSSFNDDAYSQAFFELLSQFDFNNNGLVDVLFDNDDTVFDSVSVEGVPSLWGPLIVETRVWK